MNTLLDSISELAREFHTHILENINKVDENTLSNRLFVLTMKAEAQLKARFGGDSQEVRDFNSTPHFYKYFYLNELLNGLFDEEFRTMDERQRTDWEELRQRNDKAEELMFNTLSSVATAVMAKNQVNATTTQSSYQEQSVQQFQYLKSAVDNTLNQLPEEDRVKVKTLLNEIKSEASKETPESNRILDKITQILQVSSVIAPPLMKLIGLLA